LPDEVPPDSEFPEPELPTAGAFGKPAAGAKPKKKKVPAEPEVVGNPKPASQGGEGEFNPRKSLSEDKVRSSLNMLIQSVPTIYEYLSTVGEDNISVVRSEMMNDGGALLPHLEAIADTLGTSEEEKIQIYSLLTDALGDILEDIQKSVVDGEDELVYDSMVDTLLNKYQKGN
jgi:hypothetical protein